MSSVWKIIPINIPTDGQTVWIRVIGYDFTPFQAKYNATTQIFTSVTSNINYPCYQVSEWKGME